MAGSAERVGLVGEVEVDRGEDSDFEVDPSWVSEATPLCPPSRPPSPKAPPAPGDPGGRVWLVFYLLGMTTLLPWNFFISVNDYWMFKFRNTSVNGTEEHTKLQKEFTSYLAIASNVPNALFVILNVLYGRRFNLNLRLIAALSVMATLLVGVLLMTRIDSDDWQEWFLVSTLSIVVLLNICTAIFQGGLIGVCGKFPSTYMGGMMAGQALGGIFPAVVNIAVIAMQVDASDLGFYCFLTAFLFVLLSLVIYCAVQTTAFFAYYAGTAGSLQPTSSSSGEVTDIRPLLGKCWRYCLSLLLVFSTTLSVFPSVTVLITSQYRSDPGNTWARTYFTPVTCFLLFNCGDYLGRTLASWVRLPGQGRTGQNLTLLASLLRTGFIPLFMLCNAAPGRRVLPVVFGTDADYIALMVTFSLSNGYLGNLVMMLGPQVSEVREEQESIASLLVAVLVVGIGAGSFLSYPIVNSL